MTFSKFFKWESSLPHFQGVDSVDGQSVTSRPSCLDFYSVTLWSLHQLPGSCHVICCVDRVYTVCVAPISLHPCICLLGTPPPTSSYHNTSWQWAAVKVAVKCYSCRDEYWQNAFTLLNATLMCVALFGGFVISNCRQSLVTQEAVKLEVCRTLCLI